MAQQKKTTQRKPRTVTANTTGGPKQIPMQDRIEDAVKRERPLPNLPGLIPAGDGKYIMTIQGQTGKDNEMRVFRINGKAYTVAVNQPVAVPRELAAHILELSRMKKLSATLIERYKGEGIQVDSI